MKLKFDFDQQYQLKAVDAVVGIFQNFVNKLAKFGENVNYEIYL